MLKCALNTIWVYVKEKDKCNRKGTERQEEIKKGGRRLHDLMQWLQRVVSWWMCPSYWAGCWSDWGLLLWHLFRSCSWTLMTLYSLVSLADSCTVVVSGINRFKTACREFRKKRKSRHFQFRIVLRIRKWMWWYFISSLLMFAEPYTFVINREKFRTAYKLLRIESWFFFKIFKRMLISETSQQPFRVLRKLKNVVFRSSNEPSW